MRHLKETYFGGDSPEARPVPADYPEYGGASFAEVANCAQEDLRTRARSHLVEIL